MACQASARVARGWINSSGRLHGGRALVRDGRGKLLSFRECLCFIFSTVTADGCMGACTGPVATNTIPSAPGRERGEKRFLKRGLLVGGPGRGGTRLSPSSCPADQEDAGGAGSNAILGRGPDASERGWRLAERERPRVCWVLADWGAEMAGAGFAGCWVGAVLRRLWATAELERLAGSVA